jgi:hypothetical protein
MMSCGPGYDEVFFADEADVISEDCDVVDVVPSRPA